MVGRILIVTNSFDVHADVVGAKLSRRGHSAFRLNLDEFPRDYILDMDFRAGTWAGAIQHAPSGDSVAIADIGAVWLRKPGQFAFSGDFASRQEKRFAEGEADHVLFSLLYSLKCYWMSHPVSLRGAQWKGEQLLRAASFGFRTPRSLITNNKKSAISLFDECDGRVVYKTMSSAMLAGEKVTSDERVADGLPTTMLDEQSIGLIDAVEVLPCLFQSYVEKLCELRVTVIAGKVFAAAIDSQADARTATDFRDYSAEIRYSAETLPDDVSKRCAAFVDSYGLTFGAIDLIRTPDGDYVFLENNPVGQFLFVEELVPEFDLTGEVADSLIRGLAR